MFNPLQFYEFGRQRVKDFVRQYLYGYYKFDGSGKDYAKNPADTVTMPVFENGKIKQAASFDSSATIPLRVDNNKKYSFTDGNSDIPFTFSFWIYYRGRSSTDFAPIFGRNAIGSTAANDSAEYQISIVAVNGIDMIGIGKYSNKNQNNSSQYFAPIQKNQSLHIVISDNAISGPDIYINGVKQILTLIKTGTGFIKFGAGGLDTRQGFGGTVGVPMPNRRFYGWIDEFAIFKNYKLTKEEVEYIYNNGEGRKLL